MFRVPLALALALLLALPTVLAEPTVLLTDTEGDSGAFVADQPVDSSARGTNIDLVSVTWDEVKDPRAFEVTIEVQDLQEAGDAVQMITEEAYIAVHFKVNGGDYRIYMRDYYSSDGTDHYWYAYIQQYEVAYDYWSYLDYIEPVIDYEADTVTVQVLKDSLLDRDGAPPQEGDVLTEFWAEGYLYEFVNVDGGLRFEDRMPDTGFGDQDWSVLYGPPQQGHGVLRSDRPVRASNGEATTFLYELTALNTATYPDTFELGFHDAPEGWIITFPVEELRLDPNEEYTMPVLLTVPFAHEHGIFQSIWVDMQSRSDPLALSSLEIGVRYTEVPQPAGHHDTLYFHSDGNWPSMNTVEDYEFDTKEPVNACCSSSSGTDSSFRWYVDLAPGLEMGLDFDLDRTGTITVPISSVVPLDGATLSGVLNLWSCRAMTDFYICDTTALATLEESAPQNIPANGQVTYTTTITPLPDADYIPFTDLVYGGLELRLDLNTGVSGVVLTSELNPALETGGSMQLPLNEFHDDVSDYFTSLSGIDLVPETSQQRLVNPGETVVFKVRAENTGSLKGTYTLELTGANAEWADVLGDLSFTLEPGAVRELAVSVAPPAGSFDGDLVDVTLHATKKDDSNVRSLIRMLAEVDTDEDHEDESTTAADKDAELRESPGLGVPLVGLLAAALVAARRRRGGPA